MQVCVACSKPDFGHLPLIQPHLPRIAGPERERISVKRAARHICFRYPLQDQPILPIVNLAFVVVLVATNRIIDLCYANRDGNAMWCNRVFATRSGAQHSYLK